MSNHTLILLKRHCMIETVNPRKSGLGFIIVNAGSDCHRVNLGYQVDFGPCGSISHAYINYHHSVHSFTKRFVDIWRKALDSN